MSDTPSDIARKIIDHCSSDVATFILDSASERYRSQQAVSLALDARITQATIVQFGGATVAATVAAGAKISSISLGFSLLATLAFVVGGVVCFRGVRSDNYHPAGLPPAWWKGVLDYKDFDLEHAKCWAAGALQSALDENEAEDRRRADNLNLGLKYALGGAALVVLALILRLAG
jgi:hypothetical protein